MFKINITKLRIASWSVLEIGHKQLFLLHVRNYLPSEKVTAKQDKVFGKLTSLII